MAWNIYNFFESDYFIGEQMFESKNIAEKYVDDRVSFFAESIKKENPDIVYLIEVGSESLLQKLANEVFGSDAFVFKTKGDRRGIFNACISRSGLECEEIFVDNLEIPLFVVDEPGITDRFLVQKRSFIKTTIGKNLIYSLHLKAQLPSSLKTKNGEDYEPKNSLEAAQGHVAGELTGMAEAYALRKIFSQNIKDGFEVIVLGDYNTDTATRRMSILRGPMPFGIYSLDQMTDVFPPDDNSFYSYIWQNNKVRLDHVLVSHGLFDRVVDKQILTQYINCPRQGMWHDVKIIGSDHAPVTLDIKLV